MFKHYTKLICSVILLLSLRASYAQEEESNDTDFLEMDLESLLNLEVTSVSKKAERIQDVSSSIYVITAEDIKNSTATSLHEALMLAPGYWGVQYSYSDAVASMRNAPTLGDIGSVLYLLDGTPIQELMTSSMSFDNFVIPLEDIARIEIIKGSGGVIYGANSATGVINIFTKDPDKYDGVKVKMDAAYPGFGALSITGGHQINDQLSIGAYVQARIHTGYGYLEGLQGDQVTVRSDDDTRDVTINNVFKEQFDNQSHMSFGFKTAYQLSEKTRLSYRFHWNETLNRKIYTTIPNSDYGAFSGLNPVIFLNDLEQRRITQNLRFDHDFSENHRLFLRLSNNFETDILEWAGGAFSRNGIYDFEAQDNFEIGFNSLSFGANFRLVDLDVYKSNAPEVFAFSNHQTTKELFGVFIQDKLTFFEDKLNILLGAKAEQYTLINDNFYISPSAKFSIIPNEDFTIWGGVSQSYTTPGFVNVGSEANWIHDNVLSPNHFIYQQAFWEAYPLVLASVGGDSALANAATPGLIEPALLQQFPQGYWNPFSTKSGPNVTPTRFINYEIGIRKKISNFMLETNFFFNQVTEGIALSSGDNFIVQPNVASTHPNTPGQIASYALYGNYLKSTNIGTETIIKGQVSPKIVLELSHTWLKTKSEFQENDDWDVNELESRDTIPSAPLIPEHIMRLKIVYKPITDLTIMAQFIATSYYNAQMRYRFETQNANSFTTAPGIDISSNVERYFLNIKVRKDFLDGKANVYLFGSDLLNGGKVETPIEFGVATPSQTARMIGIGGEFRF